tara:strand:- start:338 stop:511 length:174 start_codon:yes stop_codon:yes gene_type:complete
MIQNYVKRREISKIPSVGRMDWIEFIRGASFRKFIALELRKQTGGMTAIRSEKKGHL